DEAEPRHRVVRRGEADLLGHLVDVRGRQRLGQRVLRGLAGLLLARVGLDSAADLVERAHARGTDAVEKRYGRTALRADDLIAHVALLRAERPLRERRVIAEAGDLL